MKPCPNIFFEQNIIFKKYWKPAWTHFLKNKQKSKILSSIFVRLEPNVKKNFFCDTKKFSNNWTDDWAATNGSGSKWIAANPVRSRLKELKSASVERTQTLQKLEKHLLQYQPSHLQKLNWRSVTKSSLKLWTEHLVFMRPNKVVDMVTHETHWEVSTKETLLSWLTDNL